MASYSNVFDRSKNLKTRFTAHWRTRDGENLKVAGVIRRIAGDAYGLAEVTVTMLSGRPAHRAVDESVFTASSQRAVVEKLNRYFSKVDVTHDVDPLRLAMERDQHERNRSSSHVERTIARERVSEPADKLVFGLKIGDPALGKIFEAACADWVRQHADEFDGRDMTNVQRATAVENMQVNIRSLARVLEKFALTHKISCCTATEVEEARQWLQQYGYWMPIRRKRGQSMGREYFPQPETTEPAKPAFDPRTASFEELQKRVLEERRANMRAKNLKGDEYTK